jgi:hypothetical protein
MTAGQRGSARRLTDGRSRSGRKGRESRRVTASRRTPGSGCLLRGAAGQISERNVGTFDALGDRRCRRLAGAREEHNTGQYDCSSSR